MKRKKILDNRLFIIFFCFITSFLILLICSKSSPLYPFNDWVDANAFFTMGKGLFNGKVLYKDLFEQKGPLLYFIYGIGYLISNTSFLGVFIIEVISFTILLFYCYKIINLFLNKNEYLIILPLFSIVLCTSRAFTHGGSAEELCLPLLAYSTYTLLRYIINKEINYTIVFINGLITGSIFLIKFNLLGFWFIWIICLLFNYLKEKEYQKLIITMMFYSLGVFVPYGIWIIYFLINDGLYDFVHAYFYVNIFSYTKSGGIVIGLENFLKTLVSNGLVIFSLIVAIPNFIKNIKINKINKIFFFLSILFLIIGIYGGGTSFRYYILMVLFFSLFSFIKLIEYYQKLLNKIMNWKYSYIIYIGFYVCVILSSFIFSNNIYMMRNNKDTLPHYKFAKIINEETNPTILNYGKLDLGIYTLTNVVPNIKYFEQQNLNYKKYPENADAQLKYIKEKRTMFVVYANTLQKEALQEKIPELFENYELVAEEEHFFEDVTYNFYLFKLKLDGDK